MEWETVYQREEYFAEGYGPYGYSRVGIKIPGEQPQILWLAMSSTDRDMPEFTRMEEYAKEICAHMNEIERERGGE